MKRSVGSYPISRPPSLREANADTLFFAFLDTWRAGQTRAYDFQVRKKMPQESWRDGCVAYPNESGNSVTTYVSVRFFGLELNTTYEMHYRYRNSSSCNTGSPGPWSAISEGTTPGTGSGSGGGSGGGGGNTYGVGESLPNFPSGFFVPRRVSSASFSFSGGRAVLSFNNGGIMELQDGTTYTCIASGGCSVEGGRVTAGTIRVTTGSSSGGGGGGNPDLIVESPSVSDNTLTTGQSFTLRATVRNQGTGSSAATTLRYYQSSDATISTSDTEVGTDSVNGLSASGTSAESISLNAPSSAGTYYYGACVESVSGESSTDNNCSDGVSVTVSSSGSGDGGNTVPRDPALSAWINATGSEAQRLLNQATICRAGLEFPRDTFCVNAQQTILVGHLNSGEGLVIQGSFISRAGGDIRLSGIVLERRGDVRVLTQFNP